VVNIVATLVSMLFAPFAGILQLLQWADLEARAVAPQDVHGPAGTLGAAHAQ
jgi:hypothetical protein